MTTDQRPQQPSKAEWIVLIDTRPRRRSAGGKPAVLLVCLPRDPGLSRSRSSRKSKRVKVRRLSPRSRDRRPGDG
jgi:hypothetical protein